MVFTYWTLVEEKKKKKKTNNTKRAILFTNQRKYKAWTHAML